MDGGIAEINEASVVNEIAEIFHSKTLHFYLNSWVTWEQNQLETFTLIFEFILLHILPISLSHTHAMSTAQRDIAQTYDMYNHVIDMHIHMNTYVYL